MATIVNRRNKPAQFDKARHETSARSFPGGSVQPIVAAVDGVAALRLIGSRDRAEWVVNGASQCATSS